MYEGIKVVEGDVIRAYLNESFCNSITEQLAITSRQSYDLTLKLHNEYEIKYGYSKFMEINPLHIGDYTEIFYTYMWQRFCIDVRYLSKEVYNTEIDLIVTEVTWKYIYFSVVGDINPNIRKYLETHRILKKNMGKDYYLMGCALMPSTKEERNKEILDKIDTLKKQLK